MQRNRRKQSLRAVSARLLVLGHKQVGKSAAIVRFTTGRFIENYCQTTSDWLYKHSLGFDEAENILNSIELLEQRDVELGNCKRSEQDHSAASSLGGQQQLQLQLQCRSALAERVALDKLNARHQFERQQLLNKLDWANAFVVVYSIDDASSFNKAIKYLNLIRSHANSVAKHQTSDVQSSAAVTKRLRSRFSSTTTTNSGASGQKCYSSNNSISSPLSSTSSASSSPARIDMFGAQSVAFGAQTNNTNNRKPILLLGNKCDLEELCSRRVCRTEACRLASRHQALFAEISIAQSVRQIEHTLANLLAQINPHHLHSTPLAHGQFEITNSSEVMNVIHNRQQTQLVRWIPLAIEEHQQKQQQQQQATKCSTSTAIVASTVRSMAPQVLKCQQVLVQGGALVCGQVSAPTPIVSQRATAAAAAAAAKKQPSCGAKQSSYGTLTELVEVQTYWAKSEQVGARAVSGSAEPLKGRTARRSQKQLDRYGSLKASFRKASLAIASGRALGNMAQRKDSRSSQVCQATAPVAVEKGPSSSSSGPAKEAPVRRNSSSIGEVVAQRVSESLCSHSLASSLIESVNLQQHSATAADVVASKQHRAGATNWLRNRMRLAANLSLATGAGVERQLGSSVSSSIKFYKRPLFKYRTRRKTVALEEIVAKQSSASAAELQLPSGQVACSHNELTNNNSDANSTTHAGGNASSSRFKSLEAFSKATPDAYSTTSGAANKPSGESTSLKQLHLAKSDLRQQTAVDINGATIRWPSSSGPSSSSLSTSDTYYTSSLFIVQCESSLQPPTPFVQDSSAEPSASDKSYDCQQWAITSAQPTRTLSSAGSASLCSNSNSSSSSCNATSGAPNRQPAVCRNEACARIVSRASISTTGGSYDEAESSDDDHHQRPARPVAAKLVPFAPVQQQCVQVASSHQVVPMSGATRHNACALDGVNKILEQKATCKKYHLIKTVQSTINHLTHRSSMAANSSAQVAKKSFCNALSKYSSQQCDAMTLKCGNDLPLFQVAKMEPVQQAPAKRCSAPPLQLVPIVPRKLTNR